MDESKYQGLVRGVSDLLGEVHDLAVARAGELRFDVAGKGWPHVYAVGFYASQTELSGSCVALARGKAFVGIPVLARTCLEAFIDLKNLLADDAYVHHLEVKRCNEWIRILDEAQGGANAYVAGIAADPAFPTNRREYEQALAAATAAGGRSLSARDRFERAGYIQEYRTLYNFLSAETHNNGGALIRRHIDTKKNPPQLMMYDAEPSFVIPALSTISSMLLDATLWMHERFSGEKLELRDLQNRLRAFDAELVAHH